MKTEKKISVKREHGPADAAARLHGLVEAAIKIRKEELGSKDSIVAKLAELGRPNTVEEYVALAYLGDRTIESLEGEELAEVLNLIEQGKLACPTKMPTKLAQ